MTNDKNSIQTNATAKSSTAEIDSKQYHHSSKKKFIMRTTIFLIIGFFIGFFLTFLIDLLTSNSSLPKVLEKITEQFNLFRIQFLPFLMFLFEILYMLYVFPKITKNKMTINVWDGEDEEYIEAIDSNLNILQIVTSVCTISYQILFAIITYGLFNYVKESHKNGYLILFTCIIYFSFYIVIGVAQSHIVGLVKMYAPEKKGSVYDKNFSKIWLDSCDEAEQLLIGQASYKAINTMGKIFGIFLTLSIIVGMFTKIGILCSIIIGILWLSMSLCYSIEAHKLDHKK